MTRGEDTAHAGDGMPACPAVDVCLYRAHLLDATSDRVWCARYGAWVDGGRCTTECEGYRARGKVSTP